MLGGFELGTGQGSGCARAWGGLARSSKPLGFDFLGRSCQSVCDPFRPAARRDFLSSPRATPCQADADMRLFFLVLTESKVILFLLVPNMHLTPSKHLGLPTRPPRKTRGQKLGTPAGRLWPPGREWAWRELFHWRNRSLYLGIGRDLGSGPLWQDGTGGLLGEPGPGIVQ